MKILAIDQSSKKVWYAIFEWENMIHSNHAELLQINDFYGKFCHMEDFMIELIDKCQPDIIFTEDPMSLARVNPKICQILMLTLSAMIRTSWKLWVQMEILSPKQIKKVFTWNWNAKKQQMVEEAQRRYWKHITSEDECDAIAIWITGLTKII
jgi:Holliday junction resolvasome RuvABC endonuclease subunit